jgi:23S rRNA (guanine1835-N2)-methyltransferase
MGDGVNGTDDLRVSSAAISCYRFNHIEGYCGSLRANTNLATTPMKKSPKINEPSSKTLTALSVSQGEFQLNRQPVDKKLQAWEAADEYLLKHIDEQKLLDEPLRLLIINDAFGALSVALAAHQPTTMSDSYLAQQAMMANLSANEIDQSAVNFNNGLSLPKKVFDLVLIKTPKSHALLEFQLRLLKPSINANTKIIAAGMSRSIHNKTLQLFENIIGPTTTSLAWKKSRLIFAAPDLSLEVPLANSTDRFVLETNRTFNISSHANVFSRGRLDEGSQLLIEHMPIDEQYRDIADMGCGNGVLGIIAASLNKPSTIVFADESYMAVSSAKQNFGEAFGKTIKAHFKVTDCLQGVDDESIDLVLNNPPFHQLNAIGDAIAWQMFIDARRVLRKDAALYVVGNRHLGYHTKVKKVFGNCEMITSNPKFVVLRAVKQ